MNIKSYSELVLLPTFEDRFEYLRLDGIVGETTFGFDRYMNQVFYRSLEWKNIRDTVIARDLGCDLGIEGHEIFGRVIIHHLNPIRQRDLLERTFYSTLSISSQRPMRRIRQFTTVTKICCSPNHRSGQGMIPVPGNIKPKEEPTM